ncbi:UDP-N-acetylmuramoyl-L-alanine--D-glutamate ligase [Candidatus Acetothermia bacterium]|nr:UDP-N-acetylmuramoyl-L-alanine--D-glutamate ligase [Candidatus Acetothermia bacterium]MCI2427143.1 UDP-N-acetylmuramoyl-L-alanine--D-glutamate ligase [Candidatus Acetothermia bacterium]MCI2428665.1 UDP-N-acetylmuramoyl-L-alanine--D-glutamate ligase [Candidatus Acetothermia bacterium]
MKIADREISRATIIGFGLSGRAATEFFIDHQVNIYVSDISELTAADKEFLTHHGIQYEEKGHTPASLINSDLIVLSPGVPLDTPLLAVASKANIPIIAEVELAFLLSLPSHLIAVAGTNGKSTTVSLIKEILSYCGKITLAAGNIGLPFISQVDRLTGKEVVILEISSFQLEQMKTFRAPVALLLNITPDHLDRHHTWERYMEAETRIFMNQQPSDVAILPTTLNHLFPQLGSRKIFFDNLKLPDLPWLERLYPHELMNLRAAIAAAQALLPDCDLASLPWEKIKEALSLPFRLQYAGIVDQVMIYNDSKSTTADSTAAAIASFSAPIILLMGGRDKREGYKELAQQIITAQIKHVILYGEAAPFLNEILLQAGYTTTQSVDDLAQALHLGLTHADCGDILLFSPACASYDQYRNYEERGQAFIDLLHQQQNYSPATTMRPKKITSHNKY